MKTPAKKQPTVEEQAAAVRERVNALDIRRVVLRAEIDNPPPDSNVYYFTTRLEEVKTITMILDAVKPLL